MTSLFLFLESVGEYFGVLMVGHPVAACGILFAASIWLWSLPVTRRAK